MSRHSSIRLAWIILSVIFLWLRYQNTPGVLTPEGVFPGGTDSYYRLHRAWTLLTTNAWSYPLHDPSLSPPEGFDVPWPLGLDWMILAINKTLGVTLQTTFEAVASLSIPLLSLPTLWVLGGVSSALVSPGFGVFCMGAFTFLGSHVYASSVGEVDHHFLEAFFTACALALLIRIRPSKHSPHVPLALLTLTLGFAPFFWPQAWILALFTVFALLFDSEFGSLASSLAVVFLLACLFSVAPLIAWGRLDLRHATIFGFSALTPLVYLLSSVLCTTLGAFMKQPRMQPLILIHVAVALIALAYPDPLLSALRTLLLQSTRALTRQNLMGVTSENMGIFSLPVFSALQFGLVPVLMSLIWLTQALLKRHALRLLGFSFLPVFLACLQVRFTYLASPVIALTSSLLAYDLLKNQPLPLFLKRALGAVFFALLSFPHIAHWSPTRAVNAHPMFKPIVEASIFLKSRPLSVPPVADAVLAPWDYGHWILYYASRPVISHPFQSTSSIASTKLWISHGVSGIEAAYEGAPFRYLVVESPTGKLERWLQLFGMSPEIYFKKDAVTSTQVPTQAFYDLLIARYYFAYGFSAEGNHPEHWKFIFASRHASPDNAHLTALKIFERVEGAELTFKDLQPNTRYALSAVISLPSLKEKLPFQRQGASDRGGSLRIIVPYHEEHTKHVDFDGVYRLRDANGRHVRTSPVVTESMVRRYVDPTLNGQKK